MLEDEISLRVPLGNQFAGADLITRAADGSNERPVVLCIDFPAEIVDLDVDYIGHRLDVKPPHLFNDGRPADGVACVAHQKLQRPELLRTEINRIPSNERCDSVAPSPGLRFATVHAPRDCRGAKRLEFAQPIP